MTNNDLATRIKAARLALGMTQQELAQTLDVSITTIQNWEQGRTVPPGKMLEKALSDLLRGKNDKS